MGCWWYPDANLCQPSVRRVDMDERYDDIALPIEEEPEEEPKRKDVTIEPPPMGIVIKKG